VGLGHALQAVGRQYEAVQAWEEALRFNPDDVETMEAIRRTKQQAGSTPFRKESPTKTESHAMRISGRTREVPFATRGVVDRAIVRDLWERDVYELLKVTQAPRLVLDVGAHIGAFSTFAAELWTAARIIACEPDPENVVLLRKNLAGRAHIDIVAAAILAQDEREVDFHAVADKVGRNSGGGSCVRPEEGSVKVRVPALSIVELWRTKGIGSCDLLKLDCEGAEVEVLRRLATATLLPSISLIVGEWHAEDSRPDKTEKVRQDLQQILMLTHEVQFRAPLRGREGHFSATLRNGIRPS
jgi:FkbM family methyltransferase